VYIYVVDDDVLYCSALAHYLSLNPDYKVKTFHSAKALKACLHENPDIITLDYSMPDTKGEDLLGHILQESPETKIIIISGQEDIRVAIGTWRIQHRLS